MLKFVKVLQNYENLLQKNLFLEQKKKIKGIVAALVRCLSLLPCEERDRSATKNDFPSTEILHAFEPEIAREPIGLVDITRQLKDLLLVLVGCFHDFMLLVCSTNQLDLQSCDCMQFTHQSVDIIVSFLVSRVCGSESEPKLARFCGTPDLIAHNPLLSPMILKKLWDVFPLSLVHLTRKDDDRIFMLNTTITKIFLQLKNSDHSPSVLLDNFWEFIESSLATKVNPSAPFAGKQSTAWVHTILPCSPALAAPSHLPPLAAYQFVSDHLQNSYMKYDAPPSLLEICRVFLA